MSCSVSLSSAQHLVSLPVILLPWLPWSQVMPQGHVPSFSVPPSPSRPPMAPPTRAAYIGAGAWLKGFDLWRVCWAVVRLPTLASTNTTLQRQISVCVVGRFHSVTLLLEYQLMLDLSASLASLHATSALVPRTEHPLVGYCSLLFENILVCVFWEPPGREPKYGKWGWRD